jgi:5-methylcytosine-specific restriction endonuclease McrA
MNEREPIGKKLRFEVFKRDSFICQYCGARAPDVLLHADHIKPVADGGKTDVLNLITACQHLVLEGYDIDELERRSKKLRSIEEFEKPLDDWLNSIGRQF